jgi:hypothetical protein
MTTNHQPKTQKNEPKTNPFNVGHLSLPKGEASPQDIKYEKTNPIRILGSLGPCVILQNKAKLDRATMKKRNEPKFCLIGGFTLHFSRKIGY